ncbi:MAG: [FeFe] hydrogenase H-cluster maturation GTPase HydF [Candidatus Gastranaerophilales bacterium]|nr:[FeFe] hydrogenase H-cluster maturation GTPase HydF [Candidatus Gastranaerophilales bacterium]
MKTLKSFRLHISFFGRTNVGKSSLINAITNQKVSIVSEIEGTTTDVVEKSIELFPVGPVTFLDTAGIDDRTPLSKLRIEKTMQILDRTDAAVLVTTAEGLKDCDYKIIEKFSELLIPYIIIVNKSDTEKISKEKLADIQKITSDIFEMSALKTENITDEFVSAIIGKVSDDYLNPPSILGDKINNPDVVVLVTPIDKEAPKGRLILPEVQTIRDILDNNCISVVVQQNNLKQAINMLSVKPKLVVTDSQAFKEVSNIVPQDIPITSFSILFARLKGDLKTFIKGVKTVKSLEPDDKILILESCTHHSIEDDIARVKIPKLLQNKSGFNLNFEYKSGHDFPADVSDYKLIIHCGACMTNRKEVLSRILIANKNKVPITNYGLVISYCLGILDRAVQIFPEAYCNC